MGNFRIFFIFLSSVSRETILFKPKTTVGLSLFSFWIWVICVCSQNILFFSALANIFFFFHKNKRPLELNNTISALFERQSISYFRWINCFEIRFYFSFKILVLVSLQSCKCSRYWSRHPLYARRIIWSSG